jgi:kynurenine formamidase
MKDSTGWTPELLAEVDGYASTVSNWGRWGPDDQRGTLNLLTPEHRLGAAALVRTGQCLSLGRRIGGPAQADNPTPPLHMMTRSGEAAPSRGVGGASDWFGFNSHGFAITHVDAFSHEFFNGLMYNGRPAGLVTTATGAEAGSVEALAEGVVGRGVLLDIPAAQHRPWLELGEYLHAADLDAAADAQQTQVGAGDILFIRLGRDARAAKHGPVDPITAGWPGLAPDCVPWLRQHDVALLGSDAGHDQLTPGGAPQPNPLHTGALVLLGLPLLDNAWLEDLSAACAAESRWEFLTVICPLRLQGGTGSAVNPVVVL